MSKAYPIFIGDLAGVGTLIGNVFITVGHLFNDDAEAFVHIHGRSFRLTESQAFMISKIENDKYYPDALDLAFFHLDGVMEEEVKLASADPLINENLECCSFRMNKEANTLFASTKEAYLPFSTTCEVSQYCGNFFEAFSRNLLNKGDSGAPLFKENELVGILSGGEPGTARGRPLDV